MKTVFLFSLLTITSSLSYAHGTHPLVESHTKNIETAYEMSLHHANYDETEFNNLTGIVTTQDLVRKVRVIKFVFSEKNCSKNIELYFKADGSDFLAHKVVGCTP